MNSIEVVNKPAKPAASRAPAPGLPAPAHPLDAIPMRVPGVETKPAADGGLHLRRSLPPRNRIDALARRLLRSTPEAFLSIDPNGRRFWDLIDGRSSLRRIAAKLSSVFNIPEEQARESVLLFTGVLMQRHFLAVAVPESNLPQTSTKK
jgi:hypothetical protein